MLTIIAHGGEVHDTATEAFTHSMAWPVQILVFIFIAFTFYRSVWLISQSKIITNIISIIALLATGAVLFESLPLISIVSLTSGIMLAINQSITKIEQPNKLKPTKNTDNL